MLARIMTEFLPVRADHKLPDCRCLEVDCADFDAYKDLPKAVEFNGALFGLTGWNSDRCMAYYKSGMPMARAR